jgi:hypothetical protein
MDKVEYKRAKLLSAYVPGSWLVVIAAIRSTIAAILAIASLTPN